MAIFDFFSGKGAGALKRHAARVADKRAQAPDRWESILALTKIRSEDSARALLKRFTFRIDPSITDQEEKDAAFEGIVGMGDQSLTPVREFLKSSETVSWPLKMLERLLPKEEVVSELLGLLAGMDTDYERDPERKISVIAYLEDRKDPRVIEAVSRFVADANETVRFHVVGAIFAQEHPGAATQILTDLFLREESVRVRARILEGFAAQGLSFGDRAQLARPRLTQGYGLDPAGVPTRGR